MDRPLQLDTALQLLKQAGIAPPNGLVQGSTAWLRAVIDGLCALSCRDALTGLGNRRQFELAIAHEVDRVARTGEPALLLFADIDHFKRINDRFGHAAGDQVLLSVANTLREYVRPMDTVVRYGGEEFALILPNCAPAFGLAAAERIRRRVQAKPVLLAAGETCTATISIEGAFSHPWVRSSAALWAERADVHLYKAKRDGRNCVRLEQRAVPLVSAEEKDLLFGTSQLQEFQ